VRCVYMAREQGVVRALDWCSSEPESSPGTYRARHVATRTKVYLGRYDIRKIAGISGLSMQSSQNK
jgi:hypothetical protein